MNANAFPPEVLRLFRREREVAGLVYGQGSATAKQVQSLLSDPLTSAAVRSMLNRLVRKGILSRRRKEGSAEYIYRPAITRLTSRERAVRQVADDYFGGSLNEVVASIVRLSKARESAGSTERYSEPERSTETKYAAYQQK